jgi:NHL repeat-containing protein
MWGSPGAAKGQFLYPNDNALNSTGDVYVADTYNHRIQVFRIGLDICPDGKKPITPGVCFITRWGSVGAADGQFNYPMSVDVDSTGNVFVADSQNDRIQVFRLVNPCPPKSIQIAPGVCFIKKWGSNGYGKGQFAVPQGVTVDSKDNVFVADTGNQRIQVFRFGHLCPSTPVVPGVCFIKMWGSHGTGKGEFIFPSGTAVDSKGNIFVVDYGNHRIQTFRLQNACPTGGPSGSTQIGIGVCYINEWHQTGGGSQFQGPYAIAVDSKDDVYVADANIQKFHFGVQCPTGTIRIPPPPKGLCFVTEWGSPNSSFLIGQFTRPGGIAVDSLGRVYVNDAGNWRIQVFKQ